MYNMHEQQSKATSCLCVANQSATSRNHRVNRLLRIWKARPISSCAQRAVYSEPHRQEPEKPHALHATLSWESTADQHRPNHAYYASAPDLLCAMGPLGHCAIVPLCLAAATCFHALHSVLPHHCTSSSHIHHRPPNNTQLCPRHHAKRPIRTSALIRQQR